MIWVFTCFGAYVTMYTLQPMILFSILLELFFWRMEHIYKERFPTYSPTTLGEKPIFFIITRNNFQILVNVVIIDPTMIECASLKRKHYHMWSTYEKMISFPLP
jgi:hypothetical protein